MLGPLGPWSLGQVAIAVRDVDAAERFYGEVLGLRRLYRFGDLLFFDLAGVRLLVEKGEPGTGCTLYLRCADLALTARTLRERGIAFADAPHRIARMPDHDLWMTFFRDPDGNSLALMMEAPVGYQPEGTGTSSSGA